MILSTCSQNRLSLIVYCTSSYTKGYLFILLETTPTPGKCENGGDCTIDGETCDKTMNKCVCGSSESCEGKKTGSYCDVSNNICKCSLTEADCTGLNQECIGGVCGRYKFSFTGHNIITYMNLLNTMFITQSNKFILLRLSFVIS